MIAQRFKAVGWVAMVAIAATFLYLISLQVAVERGKLEAVEAQIAEAKREMRQLQTELGTRASMRQLERWNGEVLALSAPNAAQFVQNGAQLAALDLDAARGAPNAPPPMMASIAVPTPADGPVDRAVAPAEDAVVRTVAAAAPTAVSRPKARAVRVAMITDVSARDIARIAQMEGRTRP